MQHRVLRRTLLVEDAQHVVVGVPVVDLQGLAETLREVDVPPEAVLLDRPPFRAGAVVVEARLADHPDAVVRPAAGDLGVGLLEPASRCQSRNFIGVQGDPADDLRMPLDGVHREADPLEVAADLDEAGDTHLAGAPHRLAHAEGLVALAGDVEVHVVVDDVDRQGVGQVLRQAPLTRRVRAHAVEASWASGSPSPDPGGCFGAAIFGSASGSVW